jgi:hypothetical protein
VSASLSNGAPAGTSPEAAGSAAASVTSEASAGALRTLHVEAVFRDIDEHQAHAISAELIGRAHELANLPDFECDVDVSVQMVSPREDDSPAGSTL